jgi:hypothetical protein
MNIEFYIAAVIFSIVVSIIVAIFENAITAPFLFFICFISLVPIVNMMFTILVCLTFGAYRYKVIFRKWDR